MASEILTLSDDDVLCEYIPLPGIKGFAAERVAVGPDLLALLIRDGKIAHATHGAHIQVGGAWQAIKTAIGGSHAIRLLVADLKPFSVSDTFAALSRDNVRVTGEVTVELQINPEKAANVLAFASDHEIVTKVAVAERLTPHIGDRVLQQAVRELQIDEADLEIGVFARLHRGMLRDRVAGSLTVGSLDLQILTERRVRDDHRELAEDEWRVAVAELVAKARVALSPFAGTHRVTEQDMGGAVPHGDHHRAGELDADIVLIDPIEIVVRPFDEVPRLVAVRKLLGGDLAKRLDQKPACAAGRVDHLVRRGDGERHDRRPHNP